MIYLQFQIWIEIQCKPVFNSHLQPHRLHTCNVNMYIPAVLMGYIPIVLTGYIPDVSAK